MDGNVFILDHFGPSNRLVSYQKLFAICTSPVTGLGFEKIEVKLEACVAVHY